MSSAVGEILGGEAVLGAAARSNLELAKAVRVGLPASTLDFLLLAFHWGALSRLYVTMLLGRPAGSPLPDDRLSRSESDAVVRAATALVRATEVFGERAKAVHWLSTPNQALGGETPLSLLDTSAGFTEVETLLERVEHSVYS